MSEYVENPISKNRSNVRILTSTATIVFVDYLTKWPEVFAVPDQTADTIA